MPGGRLDRILAELSAGGKAWSSARLCGVCPGIAGVTGAGVMLMSGELPGGSLCSSDGVSHLIEDLQYTLGEGPCVDAGRQDTVVAEPDLADPVTRRWPVFTPAALQAGARAVFGFPLRVGTVRLGALNLYRDCPGPLSGDQHADTLVMADVAAWSCSSCRPRRVPAWMPSAPGSLSGTRTWRRGRAGGRRFPPPPWRPGSCRRPRCRCDCVW